MAFDRADMVERIRQRGWIAELAFGCTGPVMFIRGDFAGLIEMPVPIRLDDDHSVAMDNVFALYGATQEVFGKVGSA